MGKHTLNMQRVDADQLRGLDEVSRLIGAQSKRIEDLEAENISLRAELASLRRGPARPLGETDYSHLTKKYNELCKRYEELKSRYNRKGAVMQEAFKQYQDAKKKVQMWQKYLADKGLISKDIPSSTIAIPTASTTVKTGNATDDVDELDFCAGKRALRSPEKRSNRSPGQVALWPSAILSPQGDRRAHDTAQEGTPNGAGIKIDPRSSITSGSSDLHGHLKSSADLNMSKSNSSTSTPSSDGELEVLPVTSDGKKRKSSALEQPVSTDIKQERQSSKSPVNVRSHTHVSPKLDRRRLNNAQTSDLDRLVGQLGTLRRTKRQKSYHDQAPYVEELASVASEAAEMPEPRRGIIENTDDPIQIRTEPDLNKSENVTDRRPVQIYSEESTQLSKSSVRARTLQPLSPNVPASPHRMSKNRRFCKEALGDLSRKMNILSEGGDEEPKSIQEEKRKAVPEVSNRLGALLNRPSPKTDRLPRKSAESRISLDTHKRALAQDTEMLTYSSATSREQVKQDHQPCNQQPSPMRPEDEPLRARTLRSLKLEDFRINPEYMGVDFAFADSVRGKEQRSCLGGCTKPDCCGSSFRKAVEIGAVSNNKSDDQVLEEFLGPEWDTIMGASEPEKQKDLLIQARAFSLANEHGRHRKAFERRSTPPGFWRTDMPTTQEEEEDREKAQEMERSKVEERWRDAMRPNGRWKFRDE